MKKQQAKKKPCTYTLMFVPHSGKGIKQLHIPAYFIKFSGIIVACILFFSVTMLFHYNSAVNQALAEKEELRHLREINNTQVTQIQQLAQTAVTLQEDMQRINKLDSELREMVGMENETVPVSRSAVIRPVTYNSNGPQGGPGGGPNLPQLARSLEQLKLQMSDKEASLSMLRDSIAAKQAMLASTPSVWPTSGEVTSGFGYRASPWGWGREFHPGIDIAASWGTPICATADGTVVFSGWNGGYGKMVIIDHGNGINTAYAHNSSNYVMVGQNVAKGEHIADMGSTGASTGSHVHYEVRVNGERVNPMNYM